MIKKEYLHYLNTKNTGEILYEFYIKGFNSEKHKNFLSREEFFFTINMWQPIQNYVASVHSYYDCLFEVIKVYNKEGQIIKFI